ncbi:MAG: TetR family transcriptional regulator, partial [Actinomycetota bacterium]|nr:TetR family transcriptional regulator [Actinomycetota bacterium]
MSDAAADMMRRGQQPTVAEVAEAAGVHRATAYRYFSSARSLRAEAAIAAFDIDPEEVYARALDHDPITLIDAAVMAVCRLMFGEEALFRQNLLAVLE